MEKKIDVKQAVKIAIEFAEHLYSGEKEGSSLEAVRVEEVDFSEENNRWYVTLGWNDTTFKDIPSAQMAGSQSKIPRTYKLFHVDAKKGEVIKMEAREI